MRGPPDGVRRAPRRPARCHEGMTTHWLITFTDELMRLTDDLDQERAAEFVRKVYEAGRTAGRQEEAEGQEHSGW